MAIRPVTGARYNSRDIAVYFFFCFIIFSSSVKVSLNDAAIERKTKELTKPVIAKIAPISKSMSYIIEKIKAKIMGMDVTMKKVESSSNDFDRKLICFFRKKGATVINILTTEKIRDKFIPSLISVIVYPSKNGKKMEMITNKREPLLNMIKIDFGEFILPP